jgi:antirestriction protein ArdC
MQKADRKDIYQEITDKIVAELEKGAVPWLKPWVPRTKPSKSGGTLGIFGRPRNAVSQRRYSGVNVLMLWCAQDEAGYRSDGWLTFKQAKELGGSVRKGEKATQIIFMKPQVKTVRNDQTGQDEDQRFMVARAYHVFNVEQCEGLSERFSTPQPVAVPLTVVKPVEKPVTLELCAAKSAWMKATGSTVRHGGDRACYIPAIDEIRMPVAEDFDSEDHYWATLFHEHVHWTMPKQRLDRNFGFKRWGDEGYAVEELVAEMGAAYLCADHGVKGELRHAGYIQSWLKVLKNDKRAIVSAASKASQAAEYLNAFSEATADEHEGGEEEQIAA